MSFRLEYHVCVRRFVPASVALLGLLALPAVFVSAAQAQINGVPSSVTSQGFGGRAINGTRPSVTSLGPRGITPNQQVTFSTNGVNFNRNRNDRDRDGHHHHHHFVQYVPPYVYAPFPYAIDIGAMEDDNSSDDQADTYDGGPTIFDRRGQGADSYIPPVKDVRPRPAAQNDDEKADADPPQPQEPTTLVFKDGRKMEVGNYAIVGATLFDLTPGHPRKVAVADLDLDATQKQHDDRGVVFRLPQPAQAN